MAVEAVSSRKSQALFFVRQNGKFLSLRGCQRWATVKSEMNVVERADRSGSHGFAAVRMRVACWEVVKIFKVVFRKCTGEKWLGSPI